MGAIWEKTWSNNKKRVDTAASLAFAFEVEHTWLLKGRHVFVKVQERVASKRWRVFPKKTNLSLRNPQSSHFLNQRPIQYEITLRLLTPPMETPDPPFMTLLGP